ncbi:MAG: NAD(+)/NADH kinase, partial [Myxococcota bacterium]
MKQPSWRVFVICKKSAYQQLVIDGDERRRIKRLLEEENPSVRHLERSHAAHVATIEDARRVLKELGAEATFHDLADLGSAVEADLVVTLGGDGTLLWASHAVGPDTPMLAINTAPNTSVGYFCGGDRSDLSEILAAARDRKLRRTYLTRMLVVVDSQVVSDRVLNDALFSASCPAATTKYVAYHRGLEEEQRSSGVWIGPAAGST